MEKFLKSVIILYVGIKKERYMLANFLGLSFIALVMYLGLIFIPERLSKMAH